MTIKKTKTADIQYSQKNKLKDSDFEPRNIGHRISIVVPEDVLMAYRKQATEQGIGYQTLMNQILRNQVDGVKNLTERLELLEKTVFQQAKRR